MNTYNIDNDTGDGTMSFTKNDHDYLCDVNNWVVTSVVGKNIKTSTKTHAQRLVKSYYSRIMWIRVAADLPYKHYARG